MYREDGTLWYEGAFAADRPNGRGRMYGKDGKLVWEGLFADGEPLDRESLRIGGNRDGV